MWKFLKSMFGLPKAADQEVAPYKVEAPVVEVVTPAPVVVEVVTPAPVVVAPVVTKTAPVHQPKVKSPVKVVPKPKAVPKAAAITPKPKAKPKAK